jgi:hypothetical protein
MPSCGALISKPTGETELFEFDFNAKMEGEERVNIDFHLDPTDIVLPFSLFPKLPFLKVNAVDNSEINDRIQDWWPLLATWRKKSCKIKIRINKKWIPIGPIPYLTPTQAISEIYVGDVKLDDIQLFTIPSFNLKLDITAGGSFTIQSHFGMMLSGISGLLLAMDTQQLIKDFDGANAPDMSQMSKTEVNTYIGRLAVQAAFAPVLAYLVRDGISLSYTIKQFFGDAYIDMTELKLEFGDLNIVIPNFKLKINVPDVLADNPIEVEVGTDRTLKVKIFLFTLKGDFFQDIINGMEDTLSDAKNDGKYDFEKIKKSLDALKDANNVASKWAKNNLGMRSEYNFYFVLCPSGMIPEPDSRHLPTPFFIQIEFLIYFNPYKILETTIDYTDKLNNATENFSNRLKEQAKFIPKGWAHTVQKQIAVGIKKTTRPIGKGLKDIKKRLDNKLINTERKIKGEANIPIKLLPI